jgi:hypothetical protein
MNETLHYLVHMPDPFVKQILCIMPYTEEKPTIAMTLRMGNSSSLMDSIVLEQGAPGQDCEALPEMELLHRVVERQKSIEADFRVLQPVQPSLACLSRLGQRTLSGPDSSRRSWVGQPHQNPRQKLGGWFEGLR